MPLSPDAGSGIIKGKSVGKVKPVAPKEPPAVKK